MFLAMPDSNTSDLVTVIAAGVSNYLHLATLPGPQHDIARLHSLFTEMSTTGIIPESRFHALYNCDSSTLRAGLSEYVLSRTAAHDVCVFYFSGHAIPISSTDLGLCTIDTAAHPVYTAPIPTNLVRFRDVVESLAVACIDPIVIIDACFSGAAGVTFQQVSAELQRIMQAEAGSSYALLCSSSRTRPTIDSFDGGSISSALTAVAARGLGGRDHRRKPNLSLRDIFDALRLEVERTFDSTPQLHLGPSLRDVAIIKNTLFEPGRNHSLIVIGQLCSHSGETTNPTTLRPISSRNWDRPFILLTRS